MCQESFPHAFLSTLLNSSELYKKIETIDRRKTDLTASMYVTRFYSPQLITPMRIFVVFLCKWGEKGKEWEKNFAMEEGNEVFVNAKNSSIWSFCFINFLKNKREILIKL